MLNITDLIRKHEFHSEFQPLWSTEKAIIFAFEGLIRTTQPVNPKTIFDYGRENGLLYEFDTSSISNVVKEYPHIYLKSYLLFVNIFPSTIVHPHFCVFIESLIENHPEIIGHVVFEINEASCELRYWNSDEFAEGLSLLKRLGFMIAFDDLSFGEASITFIHKYQPHFIKLDRACSKELTQSIEKQNRILSLTSYSNHQTIMVLEGIETEEDFITASLLGVPLVQGYYISKPHRL